MNDNIKKRNILSTELPETMLLEMEAEAERLDRSLSYIMRLAWQLSRSEIRKLRSTVVVVPEYLGASDVKRQ